MKTTTNSNSPDCTPRFDSSNMVLEGQYPGFKCFVPAERTRDAEPQTIHESINQGPPSEGFHQDYHWNVKVGELAGPDDPEPAPVPVRASLSVDDLGSFSMGPLSIKLGPQGPAGGSAGQSDTAEAELRPGFYVASLSYDNIDYPPAQNKAYMDFTLNAAPVKIVPDENPDDPCDCDVCECECDCKPEEGEEGGGDSGPEPGGTSSSGGGAPLGLASSAARNIRAGSNNTHMLWQADFGTFRGLGGIPRGTLEIAAEQFSPSLWSIRMLKYRHPMARELRKPEGAAFIGQPNTIIKVLSGSRVENYVTAGDAQSAYGAGVTSRTTNAVRFHHATGAEKAGASAESLIEIRSMNKSATVYAASTGKPVSYVTPSGKTISASELALYCDLVRAEDGSIRQVWNLWDGLANMEDVTENGYTIAFYLGSQVGEKDPLTGLYPVTGTPFKRIEIGTNSTRDRLVVTERPEGREPYRCTWWQTGGAWSMSKGTGEDEIVTLREKIISGPGQYKIVTTVRRGMEGAPVSRTEETFTRTDEGTLKNARVAYTGTGGGSGSAIRTTYSYDEAGRKKETVNTNAAGAGMAPICKGYDTHSRPTVTHEPWSGGERKVYYTYYKDGDFYDSDIDYRRIAVVRNGKPVQYLREEYAYSTIDHVRRVEKRTTGLGISGTRLEVTETWQGTAADPHAQGRLKMTQAVDGVQTWYAYEEDNSYGAIYRQTEETRISGELVPGQSVRKVRYISADGNELRVEKYVLLSGNTWELTDAADYEYDRENNWIKRTRANGRVAERAMMCCGPLWEKDEDGVVTTYSYNTARQLVEVIRSATETTPETIISYTRDAADRILEKRVDLGSMTKRTRSTYDLLGRLTSETDELDRTTTYSYSADGLTTTKTTPTGATLMTRRHADGTILELSGTGQRHVRYDIDTVADGIRIAEKAVMGDQVITLGITVVNALNEVLREGKANTLGVCFFTRNVYNAKGQRVEQVTDGMAPTLFEYDTFGNVTKETWKLAARPSLSNSKITSLSYATEKREDGVYVVVTTTKNNGKATTYTERTAELISRLSAQLESKTIATDGRGKETIRWTEYGEPRERLVKTQTPGSSITAVTREVDGVTISKTDTTGVTVTYARTINASGIHLQTTDGRGNAVLVDKNILGWTQKVTDAAGHITLIEYDIATGNPSCITDALGKTVCFAYDPRGRKTAEWGTGTRPLSFAYDSADRLVSLITYRAAGETITSNPASRTDGDVTTWTYDDASGLVTRKTYEDGTHDDFEYNNLNMQVKKTDARGIVTTYTWNTSKGLCTRIEYSDGTPTQSFVYNHIGNRNKVVDASGTRIISYNNYNEQETDGITVNGSKFTITEAFDESGRSAGYHLSRAGTVLDTVAYAYGTDGRLASASFVHGGAARVFTYSYLPGTGLLQSIAHPNGITITRRYDEHRNLVTSMNATKEGADIVLRGYTYDELGRPMTRTCLRQDKNRDDVFGYNDRGELSSAALGTTSYAYEYDNIGNRETAQEASETASGYTTNPLNQYLGITQGTQTPFLPEYDTAGNQTKIRTTTGIWTVSYDANNRPVRFTSEDGQTLVECGYDSQGRRFKKKVTVNGSVTDHTFYLYRGYLQICALDLKATGVLVLRYSHWDPVESVATRPLSIRKNGTWYTYGHDVTKNVTELYQADGSIAAVYDYTPYGAATCTGIDQPFLWSSEVHDAELGMIYYNYRHYNPRDGRWITRDMMQESASVNLYQSFGNQGTGQIDVLGLECPYPEDPLKVPKKKSDCKKVTFIFVGGAMDSANGNMAACKKSLLDSDPRNTYSYYHWDTDAEALAQTIQQYQKKCPKTNIVLVGHSYGGDTAMDIAEALEGTGQKIILVTLDPVSEFDLFNWSSEKPDSVEYWINAYVAKGLGDYMATVYVVGQLLGGFTTLISGKGLSNTVATLGGKWGHESGADVNIEFSLNGPVSHAHAEYLYHNPDKETEDHPQYILNAYLNRKR